MHTPDRPWLEPLPVVVPERLRTDIGGHPLVAETLVRRGLTGADAVAFVDPSRYVPAPASALPGMARAVARLGRAIRAGETICVWGDFDVDGQTATALLVSALRDVGARVVHHVPVREREGHGVSPAVLREVIDAGARLLLTCDTGISAHEALAYARARGVDAVVTDHHDLPPELPVATAIVNPKLLDKDHPLRDLPGVGVAYKLAEALYEWAGRPADAERHRDLAALGIVADVALLRGDTRWLLQQGLALLRRTSRPGLQALLQAAELAPEHLSEEHIGFVLAPRLNAAGRLADAAPCVELLSLAGPEAAGQARIIVADLEALNARRKLLCDQVEQGAEAQIARDPRILEAGALVLAGPSWPAGVIGIVASRLVEKHGVPAVLISVPPQGPGQASARSVEGVNITEAIARHADLLLAYGGHPMAAGFTVEPEHIPDLRRALPRTIAALAAGRPAPRELTIDGFLPLAELTLEQADDLGRLAPFGAGNPPLVLAATRLRLRSSRRVGRNDEHRVLAVSDEAGGEHEVIWWNGGEEAPPAGLFDLAYVARPSTYRGARAVQVVLVAVRPSPGEAPAEVAALPVIEAIDLRAAPSPRARLAELMAAEEIVIWREGEDAADMPGYDRRTLPPAAALAIWTAPPGPAELRAALMKTAPAHVYLFGAEPGASQPEAFLRRLAGLVRHALGQRDGRASLAALAAATAQRESTVSLGLECLAAAGHILVTTGTNDELTLARGDGQTAPDDRRAALAGRLAASLAETAAYRAYFRTADAAALARI